MQRGRILLGVDEVGNAGKDEARRILERFIFQLPDAVHENIAGPHRRADEAARSQAAADFERLAHVAYEHSIPRWFVWREGMRQEAEHADAEVVEHAAIGIRLSAELTAAGPDICAG